MHAGGAAPLSVRHRVARALWRDSALAAPALDGFMLARSLALVAVVAGCSASPPKDDADDGPTDAPTDVPVDTEPETDATPTESDPPVLEDPCAAQPAEIVIGTGESEYQAVADGDELPMVRGGQGGAQPWHVTLGFLARNVPRIVGIRHRLYDVETNALIADTQETRTALRPLGGNPLAWECEGEMFGLFARLDLEPLGADPLAEDFVCSGWEAVAGRRVRAEITLTEDRTGFSATGAKEIVIAGASCDVDPTQPGCGCGTDIPPAQRWVCCPG